jgi:hypothetical protein
VLYFPQLSTGAAAQYPLARQGSIRTIVNTLDDGGVVPMADFGAKQTSWTLTYKDISDTDFQAIQQLFASVVGRLQYFTLLDPAGNLLAWSEDFTQSVWAADPLLQISSGTSDPAGGNSASTITNTAQAAQRVAQAVAGPSWYQYCFSVYLRSDVQSNIQLIQFSTNGQASQAYSTTSEWSRVTWPCGLAAQDDGVSFGIELPAGVSVQAFGLQVEAQSDAGAYKKTTDLSGVYATARFDDDSLDAVSGAPGLTSCQVNIVSMTS